MHYVYAEEMINKLRKIPGSPLSYSSCFCHFLSWFSASLYFFLASPSPLHMHHRSPTGNRSQFLNPSHVRTNIQWCTAMRKKARSEHFCKVRRGRVPYEQGQRRCSVVAVQFDNIFPKKENFDIYVESLNIYIPIKKGFSYTISKCKHILR